MNSKNGSNLFNLEPIKLLGKKVKRFKSIIKPINIKAKKPPKISKSTLLQIQKVFQNKKINTEKIFQNPKIPNLINNIEPPKFKFTELSLKEQYEDLINRKELILPPKYRLLLKKQNYFIKKININFEDIDFQQILYICPFYYIYQSINRIAKGIEIKYIDIPKDYIQRMSKKYTPKTNFTLMQTPKIYEPLCGEINKAVMEKRKKLFKKILINITLEQHQKFLKENNLEIFDPIKARTWHHNFDMKNVEDIGYYNLIENNIKEYKKLLII